MIERLYEGTSLQFIEDTTQNIIADKLKDAYEEYKGYRALPSEINAWTNSLHFLRTVVKENDLLDNMIVLEYFVPNTNERIDCVIFGQDQNNGQNMVVIELKQWSNVEDSEEDGNIITFTGGSTKTVPHPSIQVRQYHYHLKDSLGVFEEQSPMNLNSCVYCHNYSKKDNPVLLLPKFQEVTNEFPIFTKEDFKELGKYLKERLSKGNGLEVLNRFKSSDVRPSKKLVDFVKHMLSGQEVFHLINDQISVKNSIIHRAKKLARENKKSVIIVNGGPGTGKSVIALNTMAELLSKGLNVYYASGSKAFTSSMKRIAGYRLANRFKYFNSFMDYDENKIDVLICDEAHRIRKMSSSRWKGSSDIPQIDELIKVAKLTIFLLDEHQIVRPDEVGRISLIRDAATKIGVVPVEFELTTQFRCSGSDGWVNWVDDVLGIKDTANKVLTKQERMEFKIFDNPNKLREAIMEKNEEKPNSARLIAGFCWKWSDPKPDGTLNEDVVIGDFRATWEAKSDIKFRLAKGIPRAEHWAIDPNGINQIGSIYTIQGFEFEYVGIIFGKDLVYNPTLNEWEGHPENSADTALKKGNDEFTSHVKNIYRTFFTRGIKGVYVYFMDKDTENFFKSRIEQ